LNCHEILLAKGWTVSTKSQPKLFLTNVCSCIDTKDILSKTRTTKNHFEEALTAGVKRHDGCWTENAERKQRFLAATIMKNYLVFTYYVGRSLGGVKDFLDGFDSVEEALDNILVERNRYYQIVEKDSMKVVREGLSMFKNFVPEKFSSDAGTPE